MLGRAPGGASSSTARLGLAGIPASSRAPPGGHRSDDPATRGGAGRRGDPGELRLPGTVDTTVLRTAMRPAGSTGVPGFSRRTPIGRIGHPMRSRQRSPSSPRTRPLRGSHPPVDSYTPPTPPPVVTLLPEILVFRRSGLTCRQKSRKLRRCWRVTVTRRVSRNVSNPGTSWRLLTPKSNDERDFPTSRKKVV